MNGKKTIVCFSSKVSIEVQNHIKEGLKSLSNVKLMFPEDTSDDYLKTIVSEVDVLIGLIKTFKFFPDSNTILDGLHPIRTSTSETMVFR